MNHTANPLSNSVQVFPETEGAKRLGNGSLRIKFGVDPTSSNLHLGHSVPLRQLRLLQDEGHTVLLVIGNFTASIGDPTGRNNTRPPLSPEEIDRHAQTYLDQAFLILDKDKTEVFWNRDWLGSMSAADMIRLASKSTVAQMAQRKDFSKRLSEQTPISLHEFLYPLFQGHDSVHLSPDAEMGGTDQTFNLMMGRDLMSAEGLKPQFVMTTPLLVGLDGAKKMSKSQGNEVGLRDDPVVKFSKIMQLPDHLIPHWGELLTSHTSEQWNGRLVSENPRDVKLDLANEIVSSIDGFGVACSASSTWELAVKERSASNDLPVETIASEGKRLSLSDVLVMSGLAGSKTIARQKIQEGGVRLDGNKLTDPTITFPQGEIGLLQVGKKNFRKVRIS